MISKKLTKLVGLKKVDFDSFIQNGQIQLQPARLIPTLKTGDEMALTSIFLSSLKLVKEFRDGIFKDLKLSRSGRAYYFTEATFPELHKGRVDGLIVIVIKGVIADAVFFEMKSKNSSLELKQVEDYMAICKKLRVGKLVTVSNEFVADPTHSPLKIKVPKAISLFHFSWTYLLTKGQLLTFKQEVLIDDPDQVEIMKEVLHYFSSPLSGVSGYTQMSNGWRELAESVRALKPLRINDEYIEDAILSWYEEEKDMALLLSRKLGVLVKSSPKKKDSFKNDIRRIVKENYLTGYLSVKDAVSDIKVTAEFERRIVSMSVKVIPPLNKGTIGKISWISKQLESCEKKDSIAFGKVKDSLWVEADIKYAKENLKVKLVELSTLRESSKDKDIQAFQIVMLKGFGAGFASKKKFIVLIEQMVLDYYEGVVQYLTNWKRPAPKLEQEIEQIL